MATLLLPLLMGGAVLAAVAAGSKKKKAAVLPAPSPGDFPMPPPAVPAVSVAPPYTEIMRPELDKLAEIKRDLDEISRSAETAGMSVKLATDYTRTLAMESDPAILRGVAQKLRNEGHEQAALLLEAKAHRILAAEKTAVQTSPGLPQIEPVGGLPPDLHTMMARALADGSPQALSAAAYALRSAGFTSSANVLLTEASKISQTIPPPPVKTQPHRTTEPTMPADLSAEVARYLEQVADPDLLDSLAKQLRDMGYPTAADQLTAKALSIRTSLTARNAIIETEKTLEGNYYAVKAGDSAWRIAATLAGDGNRWRELVRENPTKPTASNGNFLSLSVGDVLKIPASWPSTPQIDLVPVVATPTAAAVQLTARQILAEQVRAMLAGSRKYEEDKSLVARFQRENQLGDDGLSGAGTLTALASLLPLGNLPTTVVYLSRAPNTESSRAALMGNLAGMANVAEQRGNAARAENLRAAAARIGTI